MPGMSPIEGDALDEDAAEDVLPWSLPGMGEEPLEEPQAARASARAAVAPAAAIARRRAMRREEEIIEVGIFPGGRTTPVARGEGQGTGPVPAGAGSRRVPVTSARCTPEADDLVRRPAGRAARSRPVPAARRASMRPAP
ncbi:hypothetical protein GCM10010246_14410 [Streptomyces cuspidosporus]|uniref:Uncharacterized protein n=1 Tax=Streptomyces cuspidosporus TaxID=66882 RepID=A0ABP5SIU4_9ACTN